MLLETILCKFGRICATENAFVRHITAEAPLRALKSAIAKNGIGETSRP